MSLTTIREHKNKYKMLTKTLLNTETKQKLIIQIDQNVVRLSSDKDGITNVISSQNFKNEEEALTIANAMVYSKLLEHENTSWILEGAPEKKRRKGEELVQFIEEYITGFPVPDVFKKFVIGEQYIKYDGWVGEGIGGYDDPGLYFINAIENIHPSPLFKPPYPNNFITLAFVGEDIEFDGFDKLMVQLDDQNCPLFFYGHDSVGEPAIFNGNDYEFTFEDDSLKELLERLVPFEE